MCVFAHVQTCTYAGAECGETVSRKMDRHLVTVTSGDGTKTGGTRVE